MYKRLFLLLPLLFCVIIAIFAPLLSDFEPNLSDLSRAKMPPNSVHIFGTDILGRDLFIQIAYSLRISLFVGFFCAFFTLFLAIFYVLLARSFLYSFFIRALDAILAFPSLLLIMFFQGFLSGDLFTMSLIIALGHFAAVAKLLDSELNRLTKSDFYLCAIALGSTKFRAFYKDLLPACVNLLVVLFIFQIAHSIANEATLSFFGFGVNLDEFSLGKLLSDGSKAVFIGAWWLVLFPVLFLLILILPLLALAASLQDSLGVKID